MKKYQFLSTVLILISLQSFAQERTKGFYMNPNATLTIAPSSNNEFYIIPKLQFGYLWDNNRTRHNLMTTNFNAGFCKSQKRFGLGIQYNYDILLLRKKSLKIYVSPFAGASMFANKSNYSLLGSPTMYHNKAIGFNFSSGLGLQIEKKLTRRIDFVSSIQANLFHPSFTTYSENDNKHQYHSTGNTKPIVEAKVGLRVHLGSMPSKKPFKKDF